MTPRTHVFRLYIESGSLYVRIRVHATAEEMHQRILDLHPPGAKKTVPNPTLGCCTTWQEWNLDAGGKWRMDQCVAEVNLFADQVGAEVVTHELFHATLAWGRRVDFDWSRLGADDCVNWDEERISYVHGLLCGEFISRAHKAGLYT